MDSEERSASCPAHGGRTENQVLRFRAGDSTMRHEKCDAGRHERKERVAAQKIRGGETRDLVVWMNCK